MSAFLPLATTERTSLEVRFVPIGDIAGALAPKEKAARRRLCNADCGLRTSGIEQSSGRHFDAPKPWYAGL
jgi:hypothetical protein